MERRLFVAGVCAALAGGAGCTIRQSDAAKTGSTTTARPLSAYDCPPHDRHAEPIVCSHTVDTDSASVYLLPSASTADAATGVELTLHNDSASALEFNPYQWSVVQQDGAAWTPVEKRIAGDGRVVLDPGETQTWTFADVVGFINDRFLIDPGTYTASIGVPNPDGDDWLRCLALFRLT
ncbi:hypothetical protein [Halarchaeum sp. P4]|uniref:hypothetical protein n=1 Tax=Halarchaeum sp. P4 TaxID=3421639 RepID=UPI003EBD8D44